MGEYIEKERLREYTSGYQWGEGRGRNTGVGD